MKKLLLLFTGILLLISLCSCSETDEPYTVERERRTFTVDPGNKTISDGTDTYTYAVSGDKSNYRITITFPDGSTYYENKSGSIGWSKDYNIHRPVDGGMLCSVVEEGLSETSSVLWNLLLGILAIGIGLLHLFAPQFVWHLEWGWRFKNAEPSDLALNATRAGGGLLLFLGILVFLPF